MKSVSQDFLDTWARKGGKPEVVLVYYKRRYWNGAAYAYEANWRQIAANRIAGIGQITWRLDTPLLNNVKASNVSLYLKNTDWEWVEQNQTTGIFAPSAETGGVASDPFLTKFQVQFGYRLAGGTTELISIFTGVAIDYTFGSGSGHAEVMVSGNEFLLQAADAQQVADTFTNEATTPAVGDGSNKDFLTQSTGVLVIDYASGVTVGGVVKTQGVDYVLSNVGVYNGKVTVSFTNPVANGAAVLVSGKKWKVSQQIETLIGLLCDQAGIVAGHRTINTVIFPGGVTTVMNWQTTAEWNAGTLDEYLDTTTYSDKIALLAGINEPIARGVFSGTHTYYTNQGLTSDDGFFPAIVSTLFISKYGDWSFDGWLVDSANPGRIAFSSQSSAATPNGFTVWLEKVWSGGFPTDNATFKFYRGGSLLATYTFATGGVKHTFRLTRDTLSLWTFYIDGISIGSLTDTNNPGSSYVTAQVYPSCWLSNVIINNTLTATYNSDVRDMVGPVVLGAFQTYGSVPVGCSVAVWTQTSTTNAPFNDPDGWVAVGGGGQILSAVRRYIKYKFTIARDAYSKEVSLSNASIPFTTAQVLFAMADFSGQTCFDAIQKLAWLCDYEWGFDAVGDFFFRSKASTTAPVLSMRPDNIISEIQDFKPGYDAVINSGQVTYNKYYSEYNSSSLPEASPTSQERFLTLVRTEDWSQLLLAYDTNLANGRARILHDNYYKPRRRMRVLGKIAPHLDLADVVSVSYWESRLASAPAIWGDPMQKFGALPMGKGTNTLIDNMIAKIVGIVFDPISGQGEYDVQEVL